MGQLRRQRPLDNFPHKATMCLMKRMYIARFARQDLLRAVGARWDELRDRKLFRIIKYINGAASWRQIGSVGDKPEHLQLGLFSDAGFAGDSADMWTTPGVFLALYGPHSFFPLSAQSKKQAVVSHSTVEAESGGRSRNSDVRIAGPALVGKDLRSPAGSPGRLPRQPGHGPHYEHGPCPNPSPY